MWTRAGGKWNWKSNPLFLQLQIRFGVWLCVYGCCLPALQGQQVENEHWSDQMVGSLKENTKGRMKRMGHNFMKKIIIMAVMRFNLRNYWKFRKHYSINMWQERSRIIRNRWTNDKRTDHFVFLFPLSPLLFIVLFELRAVSRCAHLSGSAVIWESVVFSGHNGNETSRPHSHTFLRYPSSLHFLLLLSLLSRIEEVEIWATLSVCTKSREGDKEETMLCKSFSVSFALALWPVN